MVGALLLSTGLHAAVPNGLYAPVPPPDSAFVRVAAGAGGGEARVDKEALGAVEAAGVTAYLAVPQGAHEIRVGQATLPVSLQSGHFYTAAWFGPGGPTLLDDPTNANLAKALLTVYNLSAARLVSLRTVEGDQEVVGGLAPGKSGHRAVNPIKAALRLVADGAAVQTFDVELARAQAYSVVVAGKGPFTARFSPNTTRTR